MVAAIVCQAIVGHRGLPLPGAIILVMVFGAVLDVVKGRRQTQVQTQIYRCRHRYTGRDYTSSP
jgi:hypothetical protein